MKKIGLIGGILSFAAMRLLSAPSTMSDASWAVCALTVLMAIWWLTEAMPLAATALAPVVLVPMLGVQTLEAVVPAYAHPLVFLFLGGFLIAKALERWELHSRMAATVLRLSPQSPAGLIGAVMATTAFLSMWISNTATAMLMIPIVQSIAQTKAQFGDADYKDTQTNDPFLAALILAVAFSATVGGMASLIGTPPNALLAGYLQTSHGLSIGFGHWMLLGVPMATALLAITWLVLTRFALTGGVDRFATTDYSLIHSYHYRKPLSTAARLTALITATTGAGLMLRPLLQSVMPTIVLNDAAIVMTGALILFAMPAFSNDDNRLLGWEQARSIRWDVLILFGGGLALAAAIEASGLAQFIGHAFTPSDALPVAVLIIVAMVVVVFLGELASNTAMAAIFLPIAGATALSLGIAPIELILPIGLAASLGFMLPVATPPNAIAFGTGLVSSQQMMRVGAMLDVVTIPVVYVFAVTIGSWIVSPI
ncbi:MAG: DASS family sodium-coupled anion symporter [Burkholderiaceae bacterium]